MQDFRKLSVWNKAHALTLGIYHVTRHFPPQEMYGLTSQLRRASASIAANLAEGTGRGTDADFGRFVQMAMGSASEVEYDLLLGRDLELLAETDYETLSGSVVEVKRMLAALLQRLKADS